MFMSTLHAFFFFNAWEMLRLQISENPRPRKSSYRGIKQEQSALLSRHAETRNISDHG